MMYAYCLLLDLNNNFLIQKDKNNKYSLPGGTCLKTFLDETDQVRVKNENQRPDISIKRILKEKLNLTLKNDPNYDWNGFSLINEFILDSYIQDEDNKNQKNAKQTVLLYGPWNSYIDLSNIRVKNTETFKIININDIDKYQFTDFTQNLFIPYIKEKLNYLFRVEFIYSAEYPSNLYLKNREILKNRENLHKK